MRLTINLDDELYAMARSHAIATKTSISKAIADLLKRTTRAAVAPQGTGDELNYYDPILGIQVSRCDRPLTEQDIQNALDDEDLRHLETAGWAPSRPFPP